MIIPILLLLLGLVLLWFGSDFVIESAKKFAQRFKLSHVFIGLTIVSIGTSLPEIFTSIYSSISNLRGVPASGLAVGTNIGSSITQMTLVVGLVALITLLKADKKTLNRDGVAILLAILAVFIMGLSGFISRIEGMILIIGYAVYLFILSRDERDDHRKNPLKEPIDVIELQSKKLVHRPLIIVLIMLGGLGLLILGSKFVVDNALKLAAGLNITQTFVGVLIVGVGGALPELSTAIKGITKKAKGVALGTLIGSNITNPLLSLGAGAVISGFSFNRSLLMFDLPFWALTIIVVMMLLKKNMRVDIHEKKQGFVLIGLYLLFVVMRLVFFRHV